METRNALKNDWTEIAQIYREGIATGNVDLKSSESGKMSKKWMGSGVMFC